MVTYVRAHHHAEPADASRCAELIAGSLKSGPMMALLSHLLFAKPPTALKYTGWEGLLEEVGLTVSLGVNLSPGDTHLCSGHRRVLQGEVKCSLLPATR